MVKSGSKMFTANTIAVKNNLQNINILNTDWENAFHLNNIVEITTVKPIRSNVDHHRRPPETFHQLIRTFLIIGQFFAVMPLYGITCKSANQLQFKIFDFRMIYTICVIILALLLAFINLFWVFKTSVKFDNIGPFLWFSANSFIMVEFLRIGQKWPHLMKIWEDIELKPTTIQNEKCHKKIKRSIQAASIGIPLLSLTEHLLSIANGVITAQQCSTTNLIEAFFRQAYPAYYSFFPYGLANGIILQLLNLYCTFIWNFTDNFIIIISLGLTAQFKHFNANFRQFSGKTLPEHFWGQQRAYYNKLTNLLREIDENIAIIILVSFSSNLYYICLQLFHSVTPSISLIRSIYFWFSLFFLIGRTFLVSFCAARIHDESKKPIITLHTIPSVVFKQEAKRFMEQVTNNITALSGLNFFHITRKFMLSVAGTVITYELVLIQLQREPEAEVDPCLR